MDAFSTYTAQAAATASPAQLILMLYDGALARIDRAEQALSGVVAAEEAHVALTKAQAIVQELAVSLDGERGGEVATNLADLYRYCNEQLIAANVRKDPSALDGARRVLTELRDAWEHACVGTTVPAEVSG